MGLSSTTLYYTLSTIPQVLAATTAVLAAFMFYRMNQLHKILIGDGKSGYNRKDTLAYEELLTPQQENRLFDGIQRKNISEIDEVLKFLSEREKEKYSMAIRPTGFQYIYEQRFHPTEISYNRLKTATICVISFSVISIIISVFLLSRVDDVICSEYLNLYFYGCVSIFIISLLATISLVIYALLAKTAYEDLKKRDEIIAENRKLKQEEDTLSTS